MDDFESKNKEMIKNMGRDEKLHQTTMKWIEASLPYQYSYHFKWMGRPVIQYPQDLIAMQEIIWNIKPDLIIETGIARGGSIIFYAGILELLGKGEVLGIDIDIREHNKIEIEKHKMFKRISMIEGSSIAPEVLEKVKQYAKNKDIIMVLLDSNHTCEHVLKELELYSPFVTEGSYLVVFDTIVEDLPGKFIKNRPWCKGNSPKTAVHQFLEKNSNFEVDYEIQNKLLITTAPDGYLKRKNLLK